MSALHGTNLVDRGLPLHVVYKPNCLFYDFELCFIGFEPNPATYVCPPLDDQSSPTIIRSSGVPGAGSIGSNFCAMTWPNP